MHKSSSIGAKGFREEKKKIKPSELAYRHLRQMNHGASSHLNRGLQISRRIPRPGTISPRLIIQMESNGSKMNASRRIDAFADRSIIFSRAIYHILDHVERVTIPKRVAAVAFCSRHR